MHELDLLLAIEHSNGLVHAETAVANLRDLAPSPIWRHHDSMLDVLCLLYRPQDVAGSNGLANLHLRCEPPLLVPAQTRRLHAAEHIVSHLTPQDWKGSLHAIIDGPK